MTVTINNPIAYGLVPNHYVGIDNSGAAAGKVNALPQIVLVLGIRNPSSVERLVKSTADITGVGIKIGEIDQPGEKPFQNCDEYQLASGYRLLRD